MQGRPTPPQQELQGQVSVRECRLQVLLAPSAAAPVHFAAAVVPGNLQDHRLGHCCKLLCRQHRQCLH